MGRSHIDATFTFEQVPEALTRVGRGHALSKIVVHIDVS